MVKLLESGCAVRRCHISSCVAGISVVRPRGRRCLRSGSRCPRSGSPVINGVVVVSAPVVVPGRRQQWLLVSCSGQQRDVSGGPSSRRWLITEVHYHKVGHVHVVDVRV